MLGAYPAVYLALPPAARVASLVDDGHAVASLERELVRLVRRVVEVRDAPAHYARCNQKLSCMSAHILNFSATKYMSAQ